MLVTLLVCVPQKVTRDQGGRQRLLHHLGICDYAIHNLWCVLWNYTKVELPSSLINLSYTHKILGIKCLEPSASSPLSGIAQGQEGGFFFLRLMKQKQERNDIFPQLAFSHATTLFQERCKNPKCNYLKWKSISCLKYTNQFLISRHTAARMAEAISGLRKETREGLSQYHFCRKWLNTENCVISSSAL